MLKNTIFSLLDLENVWFFTLCKIATPGRGPQKPRALNEILVNYFTLNIRGPLLEKMYGLQSIARKMRQRPIEVRAQTLARERLHQRAQRARHSQSTRKNSSTKTRPDHLYMAQSPGLRCSRNVTSILLLRSVWRSCGAYLLW